LGRGDEGGATTYRDQRERDGVLESRYKLWCNGGAESWEDKPCCASLLVHVSTHGDGLVAEYMQWINEQHAHHAYDSEMLHRWEVERFGDRAYPAAHALLLYRVKVAVFGDPYKYARKPEPTVTPGLTDEQRLKRFGVALDKVVEGKAMPERADLVRKETS